MFVGIAHGFVAQLAAEAVVLSFAVFGPRPHKYTQKLAGTLSLRLGAVRDLKPLPCGASDSEKAKALRVFQDVGDRNTKRSLFVHHMRTAVEFIVHKL